MTDSVPNNPRTVNIPFEVADLPMLMSALAIARNTALQYHSPKARVRLEEYRKRVEDLIPPGAKVFNCFQWAEIGMALQVAEFWDVHHKRNDYGFTTEYGTITVMIDGMAWTTRNNELKADGPEISAIAELLDRMSPFEARRKPKDGTTGPVPR